LHRHKDAQGEIIIRHHSYRLFVTRPDETGPVPVLDKGDTAVYEPYVLLRTWVLLRHLRQIRLPDDTTRLIEAVYGDGTLPGVGPELQVVLERSKWKMENDQADEKYKARKRMVRDPADEELLWGDNLSLEEDDPRVHQAFQALTRSDRPGLSLICLHQTGNRLTLEPDGMGTELDLLVCPDRETIQQLARRAVTVRRQVIERYFLAEPTSPIVKKLLDRWKRIPALRYHRAAIFADGICRLEGTPYSLRLTRKLGLEIKKENQ
jgi:CRISPR-associated endonuclease/helicase Cas3